ncbi:MAG TPA: hypothetical protein VGC32_18030 [Solirubrobacterales bacterium]
MKRTTKVKQLALLLTYTDREAVVSVSDEKLMQDFTVALEFPFTSYIDLYVVSWMITEIQIRGLDAEWAEFGAESSPAW